MYRFLSGSFLMALAGNLKFLDNTDGGVCLNQSVPDLQKFLSCSRLTCKILALVFSVAALHGPSRFAGRGSHEFRADWIENTFAQNGIDGGKVPFRQGPAAHFVDGRELLRATRAPERDANTGLIVQPANR